VVYFIQIKYTEMWLCSQIAAGDENVERKICKPI